MNRTMKSFGWAMSGLRTAWREEINFRIEVVVAFVVVVSGTYLGFGKLDWVIIAGCVTAVLASEMVNTAIEDLCNKVEPNTDPVIGKIKDLMSGFVFMVALGTTIVGGIVFSNYFY